MARLPTPGSDQGTWGNILNEYLSQVHKADGTLKDGVVTASVLADDAVDGSALADNAVSASSLAASNTPSSGQVLSYNGTDLTWTTPPTAPVTSVNSQTGAVVLTKADVGLGNVDNTSDVNKPVSSAMQTALNLKAPLASPTFTGTVTLPNGTIAASMMGAGAVTTAAIADGNVTAVKLASDVSASLAANSAFTSTYAPLKPAAFIDFTGVPDGAAPTTLPTGQAARALGNSGPNVPFVASGVLTHTPSGSSAAAYYEVNLGEHTRRMGADFQFSSSTSGAAVLANWSGPLNLPGTIPAGNVHCVIGTTSWTFGIWTGSADSIQARGTFSPALTPGVVYTTEIFLDLGSNTAYLLLPDGTTTKVTDSRISTNAGSYPTYEGYESTPASQAAPSFLRIWADGVSTASRATMDLSRILKAGTGNVPLNKAVVGFDPAAVTTVTTPLVTSYTSIHVVPFTVPPSRRVFVMCHQYIEFTGAATDVFLDVNVDGNVTYGFGGQLVQTGSTRGGIVTCAGVVDLSAFIVGSTWNMHCRARAGASGQVNHVFHNAGGKRQTMLILPI